MKDKLRFLLLIAILLLGLWLMQVNPGGYQVMPP